MLRRIASLCLCLASASAATLEVGSARALNDDVATRGSRVEMGLAREPRALQDERTSVMVLVKNPADQPVTIQDLRLNGEPLAKHMELSDPTKTNSPGKGVDWFDIRPRTIPPKGAGVIVLGYVARELFAKGLKLEAVTDKGVSHDLSCPAPRPDKLHVACTAFDKELKHLTVIVRNDAPLAVAIEAVELNGQRVEPKLKGSPIPPEMLGVIGVDLPSPAKLGQDCTLHVKGKWASATAWFRAYPAESLTYPFDGQHADKRDLEEKHMDVCVSHQEANAQVAGEVERNDGTMPDAIAGRIAAQAERFGKAPDAWAWYMQDDAGWGRPRPQTLIGLGRFIRDHGSPQQQFLCNSADTQRYAWTHDMYMNYSYHCTGQAADPTVFSEGRSLDLIRELNAPAPILYLVDTVGQGVRWITPAEEELASYAMLGRGARHFGWFLAASVWDQGTTLRGGIDALETRPWRYQEGATACVPVWNQVGDIAGVLKALAPHLAASAKLPAASADGIEVLPILCGDGLVVTVLLNRRVRCLYPRDFPDGTSHGIVKLMPQRVVSIFHRLPEWVRPVRVFAFDHERGLRNATFQALPGALTVNVDAVDTATLLLAAPTGALATSVQQAINQAIFANADTATMTRTIRLGPGGAADVTTTQKPLVRRLPTLGGSPIRPDAFGTAEDVATRGPRVAGELAREPRALQRWDAPSAGYRAPFTVAGPLAAGAWVKASLPAEPEPLGPLGYFDPHSVAVVADGKRLKAGVDYFHSVYKPSDGAAAWSSGRKDDPNLKIQPVRDGVRVVSAYQGGSYGLLCFAPKLHPDYDILEIRRELSGRIEPILSCPPTPLSISLRDALTRTVWSKSELVPPDATGGLALSRIYWQRLVGDVVLDQNPGGTGLRPVGGTGGTPVPPSSHEATLGAQTYDATCRFGEIRQCKSSPDVFVQLPKELKAGEAFTMHAYWDYAPQPSKDTSCLPDAERPKDAAAAKAGAIEGFGIASVERHMTKKNLDRLSIACEAKARSAWVEARDAAGALLAERALGQAGDLEWELLTDVDLPDEAERVSAFVAGRSGRVVGVELRAPSPATRLKELARVKGQVETLSCPADGGWVMAGADRVYAFGPEGKERWTLDLGENRRQPAHYGPGRNVEQVEVRPDGQAAFARTFRWNDKTRDYENSVIQAVAPDGKPIAKVECDWKAGARFAPDGTIRAAQLRDGKPVAVAIDPRTAAVSDAPPPKTLEPLAANGKAQLVLRRDPTKPRKPIVTLDGKELYEVDWPPYTLHRLLFGDGRLVVATTQGIVRCMGADGKQAWQVRRPSRIDAALAFEAKGVVAIAHKRYLHRWDWRCVPVLEILSMADGKTKALYEGAEGDDFGHYGTDLCLAASADGSRLYLGAQDGRIYMLSDAQAK